MRRTPPQYADITIERTDTGSYRLTGGYGGSLPTRSNTVNTVANVVQRLNYLLTNEKVMIIYVLQMSEAKPTQFKIRVVNQPVSDLYNIKKEIAAVIDEKGFKAIGTYPTPEALTEALEPYLHMEESRG